MMVSFIHYLRIQNLLIKNDFKIGTHIFSYTFSQLHVPQYVLNKNSLIKFSKPKKKHLLSLHHFHFD